MLVQFSHGNGFPAGSYRAYRRALAGHYPDARFAAVERIGHDPRYPITDKWPHLVSELVAQVESASEPIVLVGHSLGGYLSLMAAYRLGARVRAVVLLDSPLIPSWKATLFALAKKTGLDERFSPARFAKRRRERWPSRESALDHFRDKPLFAGFDPEAVRDYVDSGIASAEDGAALAFDRAREYRIYRTLPHHLHAHTRKAPPCPVAFIGGTRSVELRLTGDRETRRFVGERFRMIEGSHLFVMEKPVETAAVTRSLLTACGIESGDE